MSVTEISASQFQEMVQAGANRLQVNAEYVNSLNVFPVPDGDTGTNMNLSMSRFNLRKSRRISSNAFKRIVDGCARKFRRYFVSIVPRIF